MILTSNKMIFCDDTLSEIFKFVNNEKLQSYINSEYKNALLYRNIWKDRQIDEEKDHKLLEFLGDKKYKLIANLVFYGKSDLSRYENLTKLDCISTIITDEGIKGLKSLTELSCSWCKNITDEGIKELKSLTELVCFKCKNITYEGIKGLKSLTELVCFNYKNITYERNQ